MHNLSNTHQNEHINANKLNMLDCIVEFWWNSDTQPASMSGMARALVEQHCSKTGDHLLDVVVLLRSPDHFVSKTPPSPCGPTRPEAHSPRGEGGAREVAAAATQSADLINQVTGTSECVCKLLLNL